MNNFFQIDKREEFPNLLNKIGLTGFGIEIGVAFADFSRILIRSGLSKLFLLDSWKEFNEGYVDSNNVSQKEQDRRYESVIKKMKKYGSKVSIIRKDCHDAVKEMRDGMFDFIYLDANHKYIDVSNSLSQWYPKLKTAGVFAGHDYLDGVIDGTEFAVKRAVDEFINVNKIKLFITTNDKEYIMSNGKKMRYPSWYFVKK